ncbi:MAG: hypothetical protein PGN24_04060 [Microbacterium arborescens]
MSQDAADVTEPHEDTPITPHGEQDGPALDMHATDDDERLAGLLAQVRADLSGENAATVEHGLRQRLVQVGLELDDAEVARHVSEIAGE